MSTATNNLTKAVIIAASKRAVKLFRNNVGKCWIGQATMYRHQSTVMVFPGDVIIRKAKRFHAGLFKGSHDLIGYEERVITPEMVGSTVAVFTGVEIKTGKDRVSKDQKMFHEAIEKAGGNTVVARSVEDVEEYFKP